MAAQTGSYKDSAGVHSLYRAMGAYPQVGTGVGDQKIDTKRK